MYGQAPGTVEGEDRRPWRGRAGQTLRRWLELDEDAFYRTFYCASVTRCYPGRSPSGSGDRVPTPRERELCSFWFEWELRLLRPELIVAVGGLAIRRLVPGRSFGECIGATFEHNSITVIPLPHPSGVSRWLNASANRIRLEEAVAVIRGRLHALARV
jgi:uracil-DNA glycosylase